MLITVYKRENLFKTGHAVAQYFT